MEELDMEPDDVMAVELPIAPQQMGYFLGSFHRVDSEEGGGEGAKLALPSELETACMRPLRVERRHSSPRRPFRRSCDLG